MEGDAVKMEKIPKRKNKRDVLPIAKFHKTEEVILPY